MLNYVFIWLVFGVAAATVAKSKGRNVVLWTLLGLVIGPFAVLIAALMKTTAKGDQDYH